MPRTREQQREYMRAYRARQRGSAPAEKAGATVTAMKPRATPKARNTTPNRDEDVSVVRAVTVELDGLPNAEAQPGQRAIALAYARVLDDAGSIPQHAAAGRALTALLVHLRGSEVAGTSKLAQLRARRDTA